TRFLVVPVVLAAPLLAFLFRRRITAVVWAAVAVFVGVLTVAHMASKPLSARPWHFTEVRALQQAQNPQVAQAYADLERAVPPQACIGAVLGLDEPAY